VATSSPLDGAHLFDVATGALVGTLSVSVGVAKLSFSPDGNLVVIARADGSATILETLSRREVLTLRGHTAALTDVAFSPDGKYVVTASGDKTARVWNVSDGKLFAELRGHIGSVNSAAFAFSEQGTFVLTSGDKTARVWDVTRRTESGISQGEAGISNTGTFDLDSGSSNPITILGVSSADLSWRYYEKLDIDSTTLRIDWTLNPENKAQIAFFSDGKEGGETSASSRKFEDISLTELIGLNYSSTGFAGNAIDQQSVGQGNYILARNSIFAVRTSDGNYAKVQVVERSTTLKIRWVTYKNPGPGQSSANQALMALPKQQRGQDPPLVDFAEFTSGPALWTIARSNGIVKFNRSSLKEIYDR
jgi:hypothetical protein